MEAVILRGEIPEDWKFSGYGDGYGYGYGYGDGSGSGSGYGYGYGDGSGSGKVTYWPAVLATAGQTPRATAAEGEGARLAFWWSDKNGQPANSQGRLNPPGAPGVVHEVKGPLKVCTERALHATLNPEAWKGERLWLVALFGDIQESDNKLGALKREIIAEIT